MANTVEGTVRKLYKNDVSFKDGNTGTAYNVELTDGTKVGCGWKDPGCVEGDNITCMVKQNDKGYNVLIKDTLEVKGGSTNNDSVGVAVHSNGNSGNNNGGTNSQGNMGRNNSMSKDDYWRRKEDKDVLVQRAIQHQSARNSAIAAMQVMVDAGLSLPLVNSEGKKTLKKEEQYDAFLALTEELTHTFFNQTRDFALGKTPEKAPEAEDAKEDF